MRFPWDGLLTTSSKIMKILRLTLCSRLFIFPLFPNAFHIILASTRTLWMMRLNIYAFFYWVPVWIVGIHWRWLKLWSYGWIIWPIKRLMVSLTHCLSQAFGRTGAGRSRPDSIRGSDSGESTVGLSSPSTPTWSSASPSPSHWTLWAMTGEFLSPPSGHSYFP